MNNMMHITNNRIGLKDGSFPHFTLTYFVILWIIMIQMQGYIWMRFVFIEKCNSSCMISALKFGLNIADGDGAVLHAVFPWPRTTAGAPRPGDEPLLTPTHERRCARWRGGASRRHVGRVTGSSDQLQCLSSCHTMRSGDVTGHGKTS